MNNSFWMVKGDGPTKAVHWSEDAAINEAKRLARENPGIEFVVMVSVKSFQTNDLVEKDRSYDGIPF